MPQIIYIDDSGSTYIGRNTDPDYAKSVNAVLAQFPGAQVLYWSDSITPGPTQGGNTCASVIAKDLIGRLDRMGWSDHTGGQDRVNANSLEVVIITDGQISSSEMTTTQRILAAYGVFVDTLHFYVFRTSGAAFDDMTVFKPFAACARNATLTVDGDTEELELVEFDTLLAMCAAIQTATDWTTNIGALHSKISHFNMAGKFTNDLYGSLTVAMRDAKNRAIKSLRVCDTMNADQNDLLTDAENDAAWQMGADGPITIERQFSDLLVHMRSNIKSFSQIKNSRAALTAAKSAGAVLTSDTADVINVENASRKTECPISLDDDVPVLLLAGSLWELIRDRLGDLRDLSTNAPAAVLSKYLALDQIQHTIGARTYVDICRAAVGRHRDPMYDVEKLGAKKSGAENTVHITGDTRIMNPNSPDSRVIGVPLGCDQTSIAVGDWAIYQMCFDGRKLGNPTLILMAIRQMIGDPTGTFRADYIGALDDHIACRLRTAVVPISLSGLPTENQNRVHMWRALLYCLRQPSAAYKMDRAQFESMARYVVGEHETVECIRRKFDRVAVATKLRDLIGLFSVKFMMAVISNASMVCNDVLCPIDGAAFDLAAVRDWPAVLALLQEVVQSPHRNMAWAILATCRDPRANAVGSFDHIIARDVDPQPDVITNFDPCIDVKFSICPATLFPTLLSSMREDNTARVEILLGARRYMSLPNEWRKLTCELGRPPTKNEYTVHCVAHYGTVRPQFTEMVDELFTAYDVAIAGRESAVVVNILKVNVYFANRVKNQADWVRSQQR
jgi:hypothetical protein